jgi:4-hydroxy-3-methylbut-2-enyl diphosphate reductase
MSATPTRVVSAPLRVLLARPRGFCAGVERAIRIVELALARFGPPIYVRHGIVHNRSVQERLRAKGVVFVEQPADAPPGSVLIFSAHGVSPAVREEAQRARHDVIDATCPLVTKVHQEARRFAREGAEILLIGHARHVEVEGTRGEAPQATRVIETPEDARRVAVRDASRVAVLTQTTLSVDETQETLAVLRERFPALRAPQRDDICYATQNRQDAVKQLARRAERVLVVGSPESSNGMRLLETARRAGAWAERVENACEIDPRWLEGVACIGVTSGAAVPEDCVEAVIARIAELRGGNVELEELDGPEEALTFALPAALREPRPFEGERDA